MTLEQNLQKSLRTRVSVYHDSIHVADVFVEHDHNSISNMINDAYMLSQSIDSAWYKSLLVESKVSYARSSNMSDIFVIDGVAYAAQSDSSDSEIKWAGANV